MSRPDYYAQWLDKETKAYVDQVILKITASWDSKELINHADSEFLQAMPSKKIELLFDTLSKHIGPLEEYKGATGEINFGILSEGKPIMIADYVAEAVFENGPAKIHLQMIRRKDKWQIVSFLIKARVELR